MHTTTPVHQRSLADRRILINGLILIALGLSILFLNSWDNLFVRTTVGLFWGTFFLILNGPSAVQAFRDLRKKNGKDRYRSHKFSTE